MIFDLKLQSEQQIQFIDITREVQKLVDKSGIAEGIVLLFVPHTTAALTINENADPDVVTDLTSGLDKIAPQYASYRHLEGNSAAHIKSSLIGASEQVIIHSGKLSLGTWQGIYFCEFDGPRSRKLQIKLLKG